MRPTHTAWITNGRTLNSRYITVTTIIICSTGSQCRIHTYTDIIPWQVEEVSGRDLGMASGWERPVPSLGLVLRWGEEANAWNKVLVKKFVFCIRGRLTTGGTRKPKNLMINTKNLKQYFALYVCVHCTWLTWFEERGERGRRRRGEISLVEHKYWLPLLKNGWYKVGQITHQPKMSRLGLLMRVDFIESLSN